jgi:hypothetical protein
LNSALGATRFSCTSTAAACEGIAARSQQAASFNDSVGSKGAAASADSCKRRRHKAAANGRPSSISELPKR